MFQELLDNLTNVGVFTSSVQEWVSTLSINKVIIFIRITYEKFIGLPSVLDY